MIQSFHWLILLWFRHRLSLSFFCSHSIDQIKHNLKATPTSAAPTTAKKNHRMRWLQVVFFHYIIVFVVVSSQRNIFNIKPNLPIFFLTYHSFFLLFVPLLHLQRCRTQRPYTRSFSATKLEWTIAGGHHEKLRYKHETTIGKIGTRLFWSIKRKYCAVLRVNSFFMCCTCVRAFVCVYVFLMFTIIIKF